MAEKRRRYERNKVMHVTHVESRTVITVEMYLAKDDGNVAMVIDLHGIHIYNLSLTSGKVNTKQ